MNINDLHGYKWAKEVVSGRFVANKWVKLECARYIERLEKLQYRKDFKYEFNLKECNTIYSLLKIMNYATGFYAGQPIYDHAVGFQFMIWENIFCWEAKEENEYGFKPKMIEEVYLELGRKSAKSFIAGVTEILIMLRADKFTQHATAGKTRDISNLVRQSIVEIINSSPAIKKYFKIRRDRIECTLNNCTQKSLSGEANNINGLLLTSYIVDEVANMETQDIIGALKLSQMSTKTRLAIYISTAYNLEVNAFRELCDYHKKVLSGIEDNHSFGLLFELDEGDDYTDENNWIKASPLQMTMENGRQFLRGEFQKGLQIEGKMIEFRTKILNQYIGLNKGESYIDLESVKKCRRDEEIDWYGRDVWLGIDLASSDDNTAVAMVSYDHDTETILAKTWAFIPAERVSEKSTREKVNYLSEIENNNCFACGEDTISYNFVRDFIMSLEDKFGVNILMIGYDLRDMNSTREDLKEHYEMVEVRQHSSVLHNPIKWLKESILNRKFAYNDNKLLEINFVNCVQTEDTNLNKYLNKKKSRAKIDLIMALVNAIYLLQQEVLINDSDWTIQIC